MNRDEILGRVAEALDEAALRPHVFNGDGKCPICGRPSYDEIHDEAAPDDEATS